MNMKKTLPVTLESISAIIFDFDGVLTDNFVYLSENGIESVRCSRSDGLAFDGLRRLNIKCFILSTEKNTVVSKRGEKLKVPVLQGSRNKVDSLLMLSVEQGILLDSAMYVGNDINDIEAMKLCGFKVCPSDSHPTVKQIADHVLDTAGGKGVVREICENLLAINLYTLLYREG